MEEYPVRVQDITSRFENIGRMHNADNIIIGVIQSS